MMKRFPLVAGTGLLVLLLVMGCVPGRRVGPGPGPGRRVGPPGRMIIVVGEVIRIERHSIHVKDGLGQLHVIKIHPKTRRKGILTVGKKVRVDMTSDGDAESIEGE